MATAGVVRGRSRRRDVTEAFLLSASLPRDRVITIARSRDCERVSTYGKLKISMFTTYPGPYHSYPCCVFVVCHVKMAPDKTFGAQLSKPN